MVGDLVEVGLKSKYTELLKLNHLTSGKWKLLCLDVYQFIAVLLF